MAAPHAAPPFCPTCGSPAVWHPAVAQWGCDRCRQMLPGQAPLAPAPVAAPPSPPCPRCGTPAVWHPALNNWGCDVCRQMLPQAVAPAPGTAAVNFIARVVIVILLITLLIIVKLWSRGLLH